MFVRNTTNNLFKGLAPILVLSTLGFLTAGRITRKARIPLLCVYLALCFGWALYCIMFRTFVVIHLWWVDRAALIGWGVSGLMGWLFMFLMIYRCKSLEDSSPN
jgi:hypothetical protein